LQISSVLGHGVITDFIHKLKVNPEELEILGNGKQTKSYLEVHECIAAMLYATGKARGTVNTFNIGSEDWIDVKSIAEIVTEEMHLPHTKFRFTGGERGWVGDVPKMQLSVEKIKGLRWKPQIGSRESVRIAVKDLLKER
jgi:UDP-glucose 4-epimerase